MRVSVCGHYHVLYYPGKHSNWGCCSNLMDKKHGGNMFQFPYFIKIVEPVAGVRSKNYEVMNYKC